MTNTFNLPARERFLALLAVGATVETAAADAGTSRTTVHRWLGRGRAGGDREAATFAKRFDELQAEKAASQEPQQADRDVAAEGSPEDRHRRMILDWLDQGDPFIALEPDSMALLTAEQQERAIKVSQEHSAELAKRSRRRKASARPPTGSRRSSRVR